jgi:hypothetical protein
MVPLRDVLTELEADAANASEQVRMIQAAADCFLRSAA